MNNTINAVTAFKKVLPTTKELIEKTDNRKLKLAANGLNLYEDENQFANVRFAQDVIVNWVPKVPFARGLADFADMSFMEMSENFIVYYGGAFLNNKIFKKIILRKASSELHEKVESSASELIKNKDLLSKDAISKKAALAVCGLAIPLAEYSICYLKNLFTLKLFNKSDFNNIANLNKDQKEDSKQQKAVKESAKKHIQLAGKLFLGCLGFAGILATKGKKSGILQSISEFILVPGSKLFKKGTKQEKIVNKYFGLDSSKLTRGALTTCVTAAAFGYTGAAKDRGKQNLLEVAFRLPLVLFYVVTGSELVEAGFKKLLNKMGKCQELLNAEDQAQKAEEAKGNGAKIFNRENIDSVINKVKFKNFPILANELAIKNGTTVQTEFEKLIKQKAKIVGLPLLFSLSFMGFFVAGYSRFFTQYRYNKEQKELQKQNLETNKLN